MVGYLHRKEKLMEGSSSPLFIKSSGMSSRRLFGGVVSFWVQSLHMFVKFMKSTWLIQFRCIKGP
ncbi:hypothetical protein Hanom_Chr08g00684551 [Helianthus anomalus]